MTAPDWRVERHLGTAAAFHGRSLPEPVRRVVWWFEVARPAVALGSTQPLELVDADAAAAAGVEVVRRRSGGGAVWLEPGAVTWVDVVLPAGDLRWVDDVGRSALWLGEAWVRALGAVGVGELEVHRGPLERRPWSELVCFAGIGPGEVLRHGRKVVGISQRRTRAGARFQCAVAHRWDPAPLASVLALPPDDRAALAADLVDVAAGIGPVDPATVVAQLLAALRDPAAT
ncbi:MAG: lipoate--protein ligase family protein [Actinobacteria bacterium]|nr:lipoate--protein ligase family protein [Actinomycetota bacterium]